MSYVKWLALECFLASAFCSAGSTLVCKKVKLRFLCIIWPTITQFDALQITPPAAREIPPHTLTTTPAKTPACQMIHCERALILLRQPSAHSTGFTFQGIAQKKESAWKIARCMRTDKTESGFWTRAAAGQNRRWRPQKAENDSTESEKSVFFYRPRPICSFPTW